MAHAIGDRVKVQPAAGGEVVGLLGTVTGYDPGAEWLRYRVQLDGRQVPLWFAAEEVAPAEARALLADPWSYIDGGRDGRQREGDDHA